MTTQTEPHPYYVIGAMAKRDGETVTLPYHDCILTVAENREAALELSRFVLEEGFAPAAAFDAKSLRDIVAILEACKLKAGDTINLHTAMTHEQVQPQRKK